MKTNVGFTYFVNDSFWQFFFYCNSTKTHFSNLAVKKETVSKKKFKDNHFQNILRLSDVLPNVCLTTSKNDG